MSWLTAAEVADRLGASTDSIKGLRLELAVERIEMPVSYAGRKDRRGCGTVRYGWSSEDVARVVRIKQQARISCAAAVRVVAALKRGA